MRTPETMLPLSSRSIGALTTTLLLATACNNVSTSVLAVHIAAPEDPAICGFEGDGEIFRSSTTLNTNPGVVNPQLNLVLRARLFNAMSADPVDIELNPEEFFVLPNRVSPIRFDFRWECDSNGFTVNQGPLFLPQFSLTQPFCLNNRDDTGDFIGFDAVSASGDAIQPQAISLAAFEPVPPQLGQAFDELFQLASLANACCAEVGGCNNVVNANLAGNGACRSLQDLFNGLSNGRLNANVPADVQRWQPFSIYEGQAAPAAAFATYPLRLRGRFELITGAGEMITSNELIHNINVCRGCGAPTSACTFK